MKLKFQIKNYRCFSDERPARFELRKGIQALVGPNNSGKSSLLKILYDFRLLFQQLQQPGAVWSALRSQTSLNFNYPETVGDRNELFFDGNARDMEILIDVEYSTEERAEFCRPPDRLKLMVPRGQNYARFSFDVDGSPLQGDFMKFDIKDNRYLQSAGTTVIDFLAVSAISDFLVSTLYIGAFRNAINVGQHEKYFDIQIGQSFTQAWKHFKSGWDKSRSEACWRLERQIAHIFGFDHLQINPLVNDRELQIIADGKSYKASDVGSGLLQFVIVLANAAIASPKFILIDEPESNLHPTQQLSFLTTLASYAREGVLLSTHSLGLARAAAERIYSVRRLQTRESELKPFEATNNLTELLGELGFNAYRDLGFSKVLLVEGASDVKLIQQLLRCLHKECEVLLLPLGGAGMINAQIDVALEEVKRIGARVSALIDSERDGADKEIPRNRRDFSVKCREAEVSCCILERRAIENYLTDRAVKNVKGDKYSALGPYVKLEESSLPWGKEENWLIAREMERPEFIDTDLGKFLESL